MKYPFTILSVFLLASLTESINLPIAMGHAGGRNDWGVAISASSPVDIRRRGGGFLQCVRGYVRRVLASAKGDVR